MSERTDRVLEPFEGEGERLLACVHCGFCLDACPTYTRLGVEADSPRGRLYLMRAVADGRIAPDAEAFGIHLDRCLGCRACEPVCPSGVEYGHLLERGRAVIARARGTDPATRALLALVSSRLAPLVWWPSRLLRDLGIAGWLARRLPFRFARARFAFAMLASSRSWRGLRTQGRQTDAAIGHGTDGSDGSAGSRGDLRAPVADRPPAHADLADGHGSRPRAAILTGCVQEGLFRRVNRATEDVLRFNGCDIAAAPAQRCCGALHAHAGRLDEARRMALHNIGAFEVGSPDVVVVNAAGCGATMKQYGDLFEGRPEHDRARAFAAKVVDLNELLVRLGPRPGAAVRLRAAFDSPCHLLHGQRIDRAPVAALGAVPGLSVTPVARADECCGGAGIYGLTHPDLGGRILADKVSAVRAENADIVLTPNPGCMMQIGAGLVLAGDPIPVLHPVEVLAESYRRSIDPSGGEP